MAEAPKAKPSDAFSDLDGTPDDLSSPGVVQPGERLSDLVTRSDAPAADDVEIVIADDGIDAEPVDRPSQPRRLSDEEYGTAVRARIARERRQLINERNRSATLEAENRELRTKLAEAQTQAGAASADVDIAKATDELRLARAEGDTDKEAKALAKISELGAKKGQAQPVVTTSARQAQSDEPNPELDRWLASNTWFNNPGHAQLSQEALKINSAVFAEGYDEHSKEYYDEIDRRMAAAGHLKPGRREPTTTRVASAEPGAPSRARSSDGNKIVITPEDKALMRRFRLDPNNPKHLKQFALEKRAAERRG